MMAGDRLSTRRRSPAIGRVRVRFPALSHVREPSRDGPVLRRPAVAGACAGQRSREDARVVTAGVRGSRETPTKQRSHKPGQAHALDHADAEVCGRGVRGLRPGVSVTVRNTGQRRRVMRASDVTQVRKVVARQSICQSVYYLIVLDA
jgi:hypothetical protein